MDAPMDSPKDTSPSPSPLPPPTRPAAASARAAGGAGATRSSSPSSATAAAFTSAKMLDAQGYFQRVVKQELQVLLANGVKREDAVRMLLHRIVESTEPPEPAAVRSVMRQFQMNYDDAVRALIVKQELGRLKRKGMDSFAAIEELTRKMQRIPVPSDADASQSPPETPDVEPTEAVDEPSGDENAHVEGTTGSASAEETKEDVANNHAEDAEADPTEISTDNDTAERDATAAATTVPGAIDSDAVVAHVDQDQQHAEEEEAEAEKDVEKQLNLSSLTLCQRIDKVSISSAATRASLTDQLDDSHAPSADTGDAGARSPRAANTSSSANASTPPPTSHRHARKRRAPFGFHGRSNSSSDGSISPERHVSISSSLSSLSHELYPSAKKQKLCEAGEGFMSVLSRKTNNQTPPASPAASDNDNKSIRSSGTNHSTTAAASEVMARGSSKNLVKRPRSSLGAATALMVGDSDDDSPILEHNDVVLIRHLRHRAKRHKTSTSGTGSASGGSAGGRLHAQPASP